MTDDLEPEGTLQEDGESLLSYLVPRAGEILMDPEIEEVLPFGALLLDAEEVLAMEPDLEEDEDLDPDEIFRALCEVVIERIAADPECRAAAVCADVHVVREDIDLHTDAIRILLETRSGEAVNVFLPYQPTQDGGIETGELFAVEAESLLFSEG